MDASVRFNMNGDINIYPCPWESDKEVSEGCVRYIGGVEVDTDGRTHVKRYKIGANGPRHDLVFETMHGMVKISRPRYENHGRRRRKDRESVYVTFKFPKKYGSSLTRSCLADEAGEILSFMKSMKEEAIWR